VHINEQPIYHRLSACGTGDSSFRDKFNICHGKTKTEVRKIKHIIETCYIERLIYNQIYLDQTLFFPEKMNSEHTQDEGHTHWLNQTKQDFKTCFPKVDIEIVISNYFLNLPTKLEVIRKINGIESSREIYTKSILNVEEKTYDDFVECELISKGLHKFKIQRYQKEERWRNKS